MHLQYITPGTQEQLLEASPRAYALAVAIAAAFAVSVPTSVVESLPDYMAGGPTKAIASVIGVFNEVRPLNVEDALTTAEQAYQARYEVTHGLIFEKIGGVGASSVLDLFGIGFCLSPATTQALTEEATSIMMVLGACVKAARQITVTPAV